MSTAGKVLVVLILLVLPAWIVLVSGVAQLNTVYTQEIEAQRKKLDQLEKDVAKNAQDIIRTKDQIVQIQRGGEERATVLRAKMNDVESARAAAVEVQALVKVQLDTVQAALAKAEAARDRRNEEKQNEIKATAAAEMVVNELKAENAELMSRLTQLREEFRSLLESNKTLVDRLLRSGAQRTGRPASFAPRGTALR